MRKIVYRGWEISRSCDGWVVWNGFVRVLLCPGLKEAFAFIQSMPSKKEHDVWIV